MLNVAIIGASGYAGADLSLFVAKHPNLNLNGLYVSENSADANKKQSDLYPRLRGYVDQEILPLTDAALEDVKKNKTSVLPTDWETSLLSYMHVSQVLKHNHAERHLNILFCVIFLPHMAHI